MVEAFVDDHNTRRSLQVRPRRHEMCAPLTLVIQSDCLKPMPDFNRLTKRFNRGIASLEDVVRVYQAVSKVSQFVGKWLIVIHLAPDLSQLPQMIGLLENAQPNKQEQLDLLERTFIAPLRVSTVPDSQLRNVSILNLDFQEHNQSLEQYSNMVEETIDLDELAHHNFVLQAAFDPALEDIKSKLMGVMDGLDEEHDAVANATGIDKEKKLHLEKHHVYGYSLRVTKAVSLPGSRCLQD